MSDLTSSTNLFLDDYIGNMSRELAVVTIDQYGGENAFIDEYKNVVEGGINCGISGFIYYVDTVKFYDDNKKEILEFAKLEADEYGNDSIIDMVKGFALLNGVYNSDEVAEGMHDAESDSHNDIANALAMFAGEELARSYDRFSEENADEAQEDEE